MRNVRLFLALMLFALPAFGQYAMRIVPQAALPAACLPGNGDVVFLTAGAGSPGIYQCVATNTWSNVGLTGAGIQILLAQGTLTASTPFLVHTATWNNALATFENATSNVTNTASAAGSTLFDFQIAGASVLALNTAGLLRFGPAAVTHPALQASPAVGGQTQGFLLLKGDGTAAVFADLGAATNGSVIYCADCTKATPCAGGGNGALAKRLNGAWDCD